VFPLLVKTSDRLRVSTFQKPVTGYVFPLFRPAGRSEMGDLRAQAPAPGTRWRTEMLGRPQPSALLLTG
jgi:hypothetical protein